MDELTTHNIKLDIPSHMIPNRSPSRSHDKPEHTLKRKHTQTKYTINKCTRLVRKNSDRTKKLSCSRFLFKYIRQNSSIIVCKNDILLIRKITARKRLCLSTVTTCLHEMINFKTAVMKILHLFSRVTILVHQQTIHENEYE